MDHSTHMLDSIHKASSYSKPVVEVAVDDGENYYSEYCHLDPHHLCSLLLRLLWADDGGLYSGDLMDYL